MPKHENIRDRLERDIRGRRPQSVLPTERELAERYVVSRATVRHALDSLARDGLVHRVQGAGTFVASPRISKTLRLTSFSEDMVERGLQPSSRAVSVERVRASSSISERLGVPWESKVIRITRTRLADGDPMCLETVHLPEMRVPGLLSHDLSDSLYDLLNQKYGLDIIRAEQIVEACVLDYKQAGLLGSSEGAVGLRVHRVGIDNKGVPVEVTTSIYRGERYDLRFAVYRDHGGGRAANRAGDIGIGRSE